jgi:hypothetical protein
MTTDINLQSLPNGIAFAIALQIDCPKYLEENTISLPEKITLALKKTADIVKRSVETVENVVKISDEEVKEHAMEAANYAVNTGLKALKKTVNGATEVAKKVAKGAVAGAAISLDALANVEIDDDFDIGDGDGLLPRLAAGAAIGLSVLAVGAAAGATIAVAEGTVEVAKNTGAAILKDIKSAATALDDMPLAMYGAALDLLFKKYAVNKDVTKEDAINACNAREALKPMIPQTPWSKLYGNLKDIVSGKTCEELYLKKGASELFYSTFVYGNNEMHNEMYYKRLFADTLTKKLDKEVRPEAITTELLTSFVKYCQEHTCKDNSAIHEFYIHENSENASPMAGELKLKSEL